MIPDYHWYIKNNSARVEDVTKALKDQRVDKATGIDAHNVEFFKNHSDIVREEVNHRIMQSFSIGKMLKIINITAVTLAPKMIALFYGKEYRIIACCTTIYKLILKILAAKLKSVVDFIVISSQSAYIEGRNILDNVNIAHELVKGFLKKDVSP